MFQISRKNAIREKCEIKHDANITTYTVVLSNALNLVVQILKINVKYKIATEGYYQSLGFDMTFVDH